jgi:sirohydrochlorin ferrochelatase
MRHQLISGSLILVAAVCTVWGQEWGAKHYGVLLLGHGGSQEWNQSILEVQRAVTAKKIPIEVAFGMADSTEIQNAVNRLQSQRVEKIIAVPLFISSHSEVIDQTKYVLGIRQSPSKEFVNAPHAHMADRVVKRTQTRLPIVMTPALDDHPTVADILYDRAKAMSREPGKEYVVLVGHGPLKDEDNELWLSYMNNLAHSMQKRGGFAGVFTATLRDDAPSAVKDKAEADLRKLVGKLSRQGRVLVVPDLISTGGIERHVTKALDGMFYSWTGKTLLPDARITQWVIDSAEKAATLPDMRQYKDSGVAMPPSEQKHIITIDDSSRSPYGN